MLDVFASGHIECDSLSMQSREEMRTRVQVVNKADLIGGQETFHPHPRTRVATAIKYVTSVSATMTSRSAHLRRLRRSPGLLTMGIDLLATASSELEFRVGSFSEGAWNATSRVEKRQKCLAIK
jgi:hypothetical protein